MRLHDIEITEVQRLTFRPGDILVVRSPKLLTHEMADAITQRVRTATGGDIKVMVIPDGMSIEVVTPP